MTPKKRLFFALWPDQLTRQNCVKLGQGINKKGMRLVTPENLHVTLLFLGCISLEKEFALRQDAARIAAPDFTLCFNQLSYWKKTGVLCLTAAAKSAELTQLVSALTLAANTQGIVVDPRAYKPHVTLARNVKDAKVLEFEPVIWPSTSFCLVESRPKLSRTDYRIIAQWDLQQTTIPDN